MAPSSIENPLQAKKEMDFHPLRSRPLAWGIWYYPLVGQNYLPVLKRKQTPSSSTRRWIWVYQLGDKPPHPLHRHPVSSYSCSDRAFPALGLIAEFFTTQQNRKWLGGSQWEQPPDPPWCAQQASLPLRNTVTLQSLHWASVLHLWLFSFDIKNKGKLFQF